LIENTKKNFLDSLIIEFSGPKHNVTRLKTKNQIKKSQYNFFQHHSTTKPFLLYIYFFIKDKLIDTMAFLGWNVANRELFFLFIFR
jgi:hypothetical protein